MKRMICAVLALLLLLSACGGRASESSIQIYYAVSASEDAVSAISGQPWTVEATPQVETLFTALCQQPESLQLENLIPENTEIQDWCLISGCLQLALTGEYATLSGVQLTLANACITLTMCQIDGIDGVSITADGEPMTPDPWLTPDDIMLSGGQGDTGQLTTQLYFPLEDSTGVGYESRQLTLTEDMSAVEAILSALCDGPEHRLLAEYVPSSAAGVTLWMDGDICCVNLTEEWKTTLEECPLGLKIALICITDSLCELDEVASVQFLMDGAAIDEWSSVSGDFPVTPAVNGVIDVDSL